MRGGQVLAKNIENKEYKEKVLKISRVSKTTTGGRTISFSVLAAVGDENGKIGIGLGKANGVPDAIRKAIAKAKKNVVDVSLKGTTLPHEVIGKFGATEVFLKPAPEGTGIIAGGPVRAACWRGCRSPRHSRASAPGHGHSWPAPRYSVSAPAGRCHGCSAP